MQRAGFIGLGAMGAAHRLYVEGSSLGLGGEDDSGGVHVFETTNQVGDSLRIQLICTIYVLRFLR